MPQERIQAWIERIPRHIEEVITCEGNNLYQEGRRKGQKRREFIINRNISSKNASVFV